MSISKFEDLECWKEAIDLTCLVYKIFDINIDRGFHSQITRASISISNNIAEGFERGSDADFRRFLFIAKASCGEVRSMLYLGQRLNYLPTSQFNELKIKSETISKRISGLIKYLEKSNRPYSF